MNMSDKTISAQPVIIVGAGRSGTNMLRDVLCSFDNTFTWPCDEVNYIWRYGNREFPTDEFEESMATPRVKNYIRNQFARMAAKGTKGELDTGQKYLVEKTCANSLRVAFVRSVIPEAKFIFLIRDGRDVVASAKKRWKAPLDIPYLLAKARYVPISDLFYYASKYLRNRLFKIRSGEKTLSVWGPRFNQMSALAQTRSLEYVCAMQWARCVSLSSRAFDNFNRKDVITLRYEDFVKNPEMELSKICSFLAMQYDDEQIKSACDNVRTGSVGKGHSEISHNDREWLKPMQSTLSEFGYD